MSRRKGGVARRQAAVQAAELPQRNNSRELGDGPDFPELGVRNPARDPRWERPREQVRERPREQVPQQATKQGPGRPREQVRGRPREQARGRVRRQPQVQDAEPGNRGRIVVLVLASVGGILLLFLNPATRNRIEIVPPLPVSSGKTVTGDPVLTRWGTVQVRIVMRRGRIVKAHGVRFPNRNRHGVALNAVAVPALDRQAVARQSAELDTVTGVTITSQGYEQSLQSAIDRAHL